MRGNEQPCIELATQRIGNPITGDSRNVCESHARMLMSDGEGWADVTLFNFAVMIPCNWGKKQ